MSRDVAARSDSYDGVEDVRILYVGIQRPGGTSRPASDSESE